MTRYILKRILLALPALWLVLTLVFLMIHIVPGDPVEQMLGRVRPPDKRSNCVMLWVWIFLCTRNKRITCDSSCAAISDSR